MPDKITIKIRKTEADVLENVLSYFITCYNQPATSQDKLTYVMLSRMYIELRKKTIIPFLTKTINFKIEQCIALNIAWHQLSQGVSTMQALLIFNIINKIDEKV